MELSITEYAQKIGIARTAIQARIYKRDIKPTRIVGTTALYKEEDLETIQNPLPRGKRSPKWGQKRQIAEV
jgi:hypothetical protein